MRKSARCGLSLLEVSFSVSVVLVAFMGIFSLILATSAHNQASSETMLAQRACQDQMEAILTDSFAGLAAKWDGREFAVDGIHQTAPIGIVEVVSVDRDRLDERDPADQLGGDGSVLRITVTVDSRRLAAHPLYRDVKLQPVKAGLVAVRALGGAAEPPPSSGGGGGGGGTTKPSTSKSATKPKLRLN